jgi:hypothetical protein
MPGTMSLLALEVLVRQQKQDVWLLTKFAFLGGTLNVVRSLLRIDYHFIVRFVHLVEPRLSNLAMVRMRHHIRLRRIVKILVPSFQRLFNLFCALRY